MTITRLSNLTVRSKENFSTYKNKLCPCVLDKIYGQFVLKLNLLNLKLLNFDLKPEPDLKL